MTGQADEHDEVRTWAAAFVLGVLEPAERARFARHLATCDTCRGEVASFAPLPGLLADVAAAGEAPDLGGGSHDELPPTLLDGSLRRAAQAQQAERRRLRRWQLLSIAAMLVAIAAIVSRDPGTAGESVAAPTTTAATSGATSGAMPDSPAAQASPANAAAVSVIAPAESVTWQFRPVIGTTHGTIRLESRRWGTALFLDAEGLPARDTYTLWAVSSDGRREPAASWGPTPSGRATCSGATSIVTDLLTRIEIGDDDEVLAAASVA